MDGDTAISDWEMKFDNRKDVNDRLESNAFGNPWFRKVKAKRQLSPRFALAFPITDRGHMHFSYGHFLILFLGLFLTTNGIRKNFLITQKREKPYFRLYSDFKYV